MLGVPIIAQQKQIRLVTMRLCIQSLALLSGLQIQRCHELWCWLQMWLGSVVAVAPIRPLALNLHVCRGCAHTHTHTDTKETIVQGEEYQKFAEIFLKTTQ